MSAYLNLEPFRSRSKSYINIRSQDNILPCDGQHEVKVDYIIKQEKLKGGVSHLYLHYLVRNKARQWLFYCYHRGRSHSLFALFLPYQLYQE